MYQENDILKRRKKGKKKSPFDHSHSHNPLSILIKFKLFSSSRTRIKFFESSPPRPVPKIVNSWPQLRYRERLENVNSSPFNEEGGCDDFLFQGENRIVLYTGFLKDLDVLNFAGVMGMTRGNEVLLPRGGIIPTESYIILRATWTPSARGWFKGEVMGLARVNRASAKEARSSRKHSSSAIVSNDPDGSISIGFVTRFNGIVTSWFQFGILFVHNVPGYDGCDFVFLFLLLSWKKLIGNVSLWVENSLDENVYYLFYINLDLVYYSFK